MERSLSRQIFFFFFYYLLLFTFLLGEEPYIYDVHAKVGLGRSKICHVSADSIVLNK